MHYNIRSFLCSTSLALIIGLASGQNALAQGNVSLVEDGLPNIEIEKEAGNMGLDNSAAVPAAADAAAVSVETQAASVELVVPAASDPIPPADDLFAGSDASGLATAPAQAHPMTEKIEIVTETTSVDQPLLTDEKLGDVILSQTSNEMFARMSELERQTALLTLELRREKIKNEIDALKAQRKKAEQEEIAAREEEERKKIEWKNKQEKALLEEKQKLKEKEIVLEKLRQQKILQAYKETMLLENQKWIESNEKFYAELMENDKSREALLEDAKTKLAHLGGVANQINDAANAAKLNYQREIANINSQLDIFKSRLEAAEVEKSTSKTNPFSDIALSSEPLEEKISQKYSIVEIRGQGDEIVAKLKNKEGVAFTVKRGTKLQSGHVIDEIEQTYIRADKGGYKDFIYFSSGGVIDQEPNEAFVPKISVSEEKKEATTESNSVGGSGIPNLWDGMFVK